MYLLISYFYSARPVRLKSWPFVDLVSHSLMLGGLLILTAYSAYLTSVGKAWYIIAAAIFFSIYGQIYNQLRDLDADKKSKLKNTTIFLGKEKSRYLSYLSLFLGISCLLISLFKGLFPLWLIPILLISVLLSFMFKKDKDFRGASFVDPTGEYQLSGYIIMNAVIFSWFLVSVLI